MGRPSAALVVACAALVTAACGDPIIVLGDTPGVMRIALGVGDSVGIRVDSIATRTRLTEPRGLTFDHTAGVLYAADRGALRQVSGTTTRVARIFNVTSSGRSSLLLDGGGCAVNVCILEVTAMAQASDGSLVIADAVGNRIFRYRPGVPLTVLAGTGALAFAEDGAPAASSPVRNPAGVAIDDAGVIHFSESGASRVRKILPDGTLSTVAGNGARTHSGDGGDARAAGLMEPAGLFFHGGMLYIADYGAHTVRRIGADGRIATLAGIGGAEGFGGDGAAAQQALLSRPTDIAVTPDGLTLFIADTGNDRVRVVDLASLAIRTFAGTGSRTWTGNRRLAGATSLAGPNTVATGPNGILFIADPGHSVVWRTTVSY